MSLRRTFVLGFALVSSLVLPSVARATLVIPPDFTSLVKQADYVVRAVVTSVDSSWSYENGNRHIITKVGLTVSEVIAGTPPQPLVLQMLGGTVDGVTMKVDGAPVFKVGDDNILFVHGNGTQFIPLVALTNGQYPVQHDAKTGQDFVLRSNGIPLYSAQDVATPMTRLSTVKVQSDAAQPLTVSDFATQIRAEVARAGRPVAQN
jgi:hypothetical protein